MKKREGATAQSGNIEKPVNFRGMGEGAIEALVGKAGLTKLKNQMRKADERYEKAREEAKQMIRNGASDKQIIQEVGFDTSIGILRDEVEREANN